MPVLLQAGPAVAFAGGSPASVSPAVPSPPSSQDVLVALAGISPPVPSSVLPPVSPPVSVPAPAPGPSLSPLPSPSPSPTAAAAAAASAAAAVSPSPSQPTQARSSAAVPAGLSLLQVMLTGDAR